MVNIKIKTIPYKKQRYLTAGDYWKDGTNTTQFRVNNMDSSTAEMLVAIHEMIEAFLAQEAGIYWSKIDQFDIDHPELDDPGSDIRSPYYRQHMIAEVVERLLCLEVGLNWEEYSKIVEESCE